MNDTTNIKKISKKSKIEFKSLPLRQVLTNNGFSEFDRQYIEKNGGKELGMPTNNWYRIISIGTTKLELAAIVGAYIGLPVTAFFEFSHQIKQYNDK